MSYESNSSSSASSEPLSHATVPQVPSLPISRIGTSSSPLSDPVSPRQRPLLHRYYDLCEEIQNLNLEHVMMPTDLQQKPLTETLFDTILKRDPSNAGKFGVREYNGLLRNENIVSPHLHLKYPENLGVVLTSAVVNARMTLGYWHNRLLHTVINRYFQPALHEPLEQYITNNAMQSPIAEQEELEINEETNKVEIEIRFLRDNLLRKRKVSESILSDLLSTAVRTPRSPRDIMSPERLAHEALFAIRCLNQITADQERFDELLIQEKRLLDLKAAISDFEHELIRIKDNEPALFSTLEQWDRLYYSPQQAALEWLKLTKKSTSTRKLSPTVQRSFCQAFLQSDVNLERLLPVYHKNQKSRHTFCEHPQTLIEDGSFYISGAFLHELARHACESSPPLSFQATLKKWSSLPFNVAMTSEPSTSSKPSTSSQSNESGYSPQPRRRGSITSIRNKLLSSSLLSPRKEPTSPRSKTSSIVDDSEIIATTSSTLSAAIKNDTPPISPREGSTSPRIDQSSLPSPTPSRQVDFSGVRNTPLEPSKAKKISPRTTKGHFKITHTLASPRSLLGGKGPGKELSIESLHSGSSPPSSLPAPISGSSPPKHSLR